MLDRAIQSLRDDAAMAQGLPDITARRTVAALWEAQVRAAQRRSQWVMRIAAVIVLSVCAVATAIVALQRRQLLANAPTHLPLPGPVDPNISPAPTVRPISLIDDPTPADPPAQPPVSVAAEVMLTGHVYLEGSRPNRQEIDVRAYPAAMASMPGPIFDESIVVNRDGTLANVVVSISGPLPADHAYPSPPQVVLNQRYCSFSPHVVAAVIGQQMMLKNADRIPYNAHAVNSATAIGFNSPTPGIGPRTIEAFPAVDTFEVRSDLFPWMHAWVRVLDNPFFDVTRSDGSFSIKDLPPGKYTLHAWHESLGDREKEITVDGGEPVVVDFAFEAK
ncbi:MAG TPA: carboxypeptidase regulatory-like domain-containing protein [Tepidisphaeraceae bacterium]